MHSVGACAGAGMIAIVGWLGEVMTKREAMGLGDVTLMAFVGAALGPSRALITVFLGATLGAVAFAGVVIPVALLRRGHAREQTELALGSHAVRDAARTVRCIPCACCAADIVLGRRPARVAHDGV